MPLPSFDSLYKAADAVDAPVPVVAAGGADATVIQAFEFARRRGWIKPILTGEVDRIRELAESLDIDLHSFEILEDDPQSAQVAVAAVHDRKASLVVKGQISTPYLMKAILNKETGLRTGKTIAQVVLMEIERDQRSFLMTDTGVTIAPTLEQKADLVEHVTATAHALGCQAPRVAMMSATEKVNEALPDTLDAAALAERSEQGEFSDAIVQGPLSFDLAYAVDAASKKGIGGDVTGAADAMVFPDLLSANLTVKGIMYTAGCQFGGILCGTTSPVVFMSRADTVETRMNSLAYALAVAGKTHIARGN